MQAWGFDTKVGELFPHIVILPQSDAFVWGRPETASSTSHLVHLISAQLASQPAISRLRVFDFCTGTGCIPLLFHDEFYKHSHLRTVVLDARGYDISPQAISLAYENLNLQWEMAANRNLYGNELEGSLICRDHSLRQLRFERYDVLAAASGLNDSESVENQLHPQDHKKSEAPNAPSSLNACMDTKCDILISNPPYISPADYKQTTARSVRKFEPKLALVPPSQNNSDHLSRRDKDQGDLFYPHLLDLAQRLSAKLVLLEVADLEQAKRVVSLVLERLNWNVDVEIWRDEPARGWVEEVVIDGRAIKVSGEGNGRTVFVRRRGVDLLGC